MVPENEKEPHFPNLHLWGFHLSFEECGYHAWPTFMGEPKLIPQNTQQSLSSLSFGVRPSTITPHQEKKYTPNLSTTDLPDLPEGNFPFLQRWWTGAGLNLAEILKIASQTWQLNPHHPKWWILFLKQIAGVMDVGVRHCWSEVLLFNSQASTDSFPASNLGQKSHKNW